MSRVASQIHPQSVDVSIVIVNYNVRYFLEQCLLSVQEAVKGLAAEIFVVDNASSDDSLSMLLRFPDVVVIANRENVGFAKANNQAIKLSKGRYVLLLNPDTLIAHDTLSKCLSLADSDTAIGCIGARMIDGRGAFLPESKRGFPSAWVSFAKMSGLSKLAPASQRWNGYYQGHLSEFETNEVDVLPGAFMWLRASLLPEVGGGLDEDYFMYGEDIDLSYLIQKAGYKNIYFPEATILHYKGESTRKRSVKHVKNFYEAMVIFAKKHVYGPQSGLHKLILQVAIYGRAFLALALNTLAALTMVLIDAALILGLLMVLKTAWATFYFETPNYYQQNFTAVNAPLYMGLWILGLWLLGAYDRPYRIPAAIKGVAAGSLLVLVAYALLPFELRSSRAIILLGSAAAAILLPVARILWSFLRPKDVSYTVKAEGNDRRLAIIASEEETKRILSLLAKAGVAREYVGRICPEENETRDSLGTLGELQSLLEAYRFDELIFGNKDVSYTETILWLDKLGEQVEVRTVGQNSEAIVGSPARTQPGAPYTVGARYALANSEARRSKRSFDVTFSILLLICWPIVVLRFRSFDVLRNAISVFLGSATWIGYSPGGAQEGDLPALRPAVLPQGYTNGELSKIDIHRLNELYARYYRRRDDWRRITSDWKNLGRQPTAILRVAPPRWPNRALKAVSYTDPHAAL